MVINKHGDLLYQGLVETVGKHLEEVAGQVEQSHGDVLLRDLTARWADHTKSMHMIRDILMVRTLF